MTKAITLAAAGLCAALFAGGASAATVAFADTTGGDNAVTPGFFGVSFTSSQGLFLSEVSFDLSSVPGGFFDFDGVTSFQDATAPVFSDLVGLDLADIAFSLGGGGPGAPSKLTLSFASGAFGDGDSLRFGADTDEFGPGGSRTTGVTFGVQGAVFEALFSNGDGGSSVFEIAGSNRSEASVSAVPLPGGLALLMTGLAGFVALRRRAP
ncbi:MAG: VPLPA-CTERM sorting domain-containing protein [Pseudomonadota bacterium]